MAVSAVIIAPHHPEAQGGGTGQDVEKRLFLNGVALQGSDISYWYLECSAFVEPDLANTDPIEKKPFFHSRCRPSSAPEL